MIKATKIRMKYGSRYFNDLLEIDSIYLEGYAKPGFYKKEVLYDYLKENPGSIVVGIYPYPKLIPEISWQGEKYVRSTPNNYHNDNLLALPRE